MARQNYAQEVDTTLEIVKTVVGIYDPKSDELWDLKKAKKPSAHGVFKGKGYEWQISVKLYLSNVIDPKTGRALEDWKFPDLVYTKGYVPEEVESMLTKMSQDENVFDQVFFKVKAGKRDGVKYGDGSKSYHYQWDILSWGERLNEAPKSVPQPYKSKYETGSYKDVIIDKGYDTEEAGNKDTIIESGESTPEYRSNPSVQKDRDSSIQYQGLLKVAAECVSAYPGDYVSADAMFAEACKLALSEMARCSDPLNHREESERVATEEEQLEEKMSQY